MRNLPAIEWYESPEAKNLQSGKTIIDFVPCHVLKYLRSVLSCQSVPRDQFRNQFRPVQSVVWKQKAKILNL